MDRCTVQTVRETQGDALFERVSSNRSIEREKMREGRRDYLSERHLTDSRSFVCGDDSVTRFHVPSLSREVRDFSVKDRRSSRLRNRS